MSVRSIFYKLYKEYDRTSIFLIYKSGKHKTVLCTLYNIINMLPTKRNGFYFNSLFTLLFIFFCD